MNKLSPTTAWQNPNAAPYRILFASDPQYPWAEDIISSPALTSDGTTLYMMYRIQAAKPNQKSSNMLYIAYSEDGEYWPIPKAIDSLQASTVPSLTYDSGNIYIVYQDPHASGEFNLLTCTTEKFKSASVGPPVKLGLTSNGMPGIVRFKNDLIIVFSTANGSLMYYSLQSKEKKVILANGYSNASVTLTLIDNAGTQSIAGIIVNGGNMTYISSSDGKKWSNSISIANTISGAVALTTYLDSNNKALPTAFFTNYDNGAITICQIKMNSKGTWDSVSNLRIHTSNNIVGAAWFTPKSKTGKVSVANTWIVYKSNDVYDFIYSTTSDSYPYPGWRTQIHKPNNDNGPSPDANTSKNQIQGVFNSMVTLSKKADSTAAKAGRVECVMINGDLTKGHSAHQRETIQDLLAIIANGGLQFAFGLGNHDYINNVGDSSEDAVNMIRMLYNYMGKLADGGVDISYSTKASQNYYEGTGIVQLKKPNVRLVQFNYSPVQTASFIGHGNQINHVDIKTAINKFADLLESAKKDNITLIPCMHSYDDWDTKEFDRLISKYKVPAVFAGHLHNEIGFQKNIGSNSDVPLFRCGSSTYQNYLEAAFNFTSNTMTVSVIMSEGNDYVRLSNTEVFALNPLI